MCQCFKPNDTKGQSQKDAFRGWTAFVSSSGALEICSQQKYVHNNMWWILSPGRCNAEQYSSTVYFFHLYVSMLFSYYSGYFEFTLNSFSNLSIDDCEFSDGVARSCTQLQRRCALRLLRSPKCRLVLGPGTELWNLETKRTNEWANKWKMLDEKLPWIDGSNRSFIIFIIHSAGYPHIFSLEGQMKTPKMLSKLVWTFVEVLLMKIHFEKAG